jgi:hypothetical protein
MPWLLERLFAHQDQPTPRFAFQGTVNWLRALTIGVEATGYTHPDIRARYQSVQRRTPNAVMDSLAYEFLTMTISHAAAVLAMRNAGGNPYDFCRAGIVAWYYTIYYGAKAMLAACSGCDPQTHAATARIFQSDIVRRGLAFYPFDLYVDGLTPAQVAAEITRLRGAAASDLNATPTNPTEAHGALCSYLKGTCEYRQWEIEERTRHTAAFRALGVQNFRTLKARQLRDGGLKVECVNFLVQAFRYRGKANYRDAIYLSYGNDNTDVLRQLIADLSTCSSAFALMAAHYISRRAERATWPEYVADMRTSARISLPFDLLAI